MIFEECTSIEDNANSGHLRNDYVIKNAYFDKCYSEQRLVSISDPEKWTTIRLNEKKKHVKRDYK